MATYRMSDLERIRAATGTKRPKLMFKVYSAFTLEGESVSVVSQKTRMEASRVSHYVRRLLIGDYIEELPDEPGLYRRNGRNPITEDYWIWRAQLENVQKLFARSPVRLQNPPIIKDHARIIQWIDAKKGEFTAKQIKTGTRIMNRITSYLNKLVNSGKIKIVRREGPYHHYVYRKTSKWSKHHGP